MARGKEAHRRWPIASVAVVLGLALAGCANSTVTVTVRESSHHSNLPQSSSPAAKRTPTADSKPHGLAGFATCGASDPYTEVYARVPHTSCAFALSVDRAVANSPATTSLSAGESFHVTARSLVTGKTYDLACQSVGKWIDCVTGNARVRITIQGGGSPSRPAPPTKAAPQPSASSPTCSEWLAADGQQQEAMLKTEGYPASYMQVMDSNGNPELLRATASDCEVEATATLIEVAPAVMDTDSFPWYQQTQLSPSPCDLVNRFRVAAHLHGDGLLCSIPADGQVANTATGSNPTVTKQTTCSNWLNTANAEYLAGFLDSVGWTPSDVAAETRIVAAGCANASGNGVGYETVWSLVKAGSSTTSTGQSHDPSECYLGNASNIAQAYKKLPKWCKTSG